MTRMRLDRGVSLLEALVAMAVMAVGAVAVVGLQATLRGNSDISRQRADAMRLAQVPIERFRGFRTFDATAAIDDWTDIVDTVEPGLVPPNSNTSYTREITVVAQGTPTNNEPRSKTVHVVVKWNDRTGTEQSVEVNTVIAGVLPDLGGTLSVTHTSSPLRSADGRHPAVPRGAVDLGNGTSRFSPPGAGTESWVFNNVTGLVVQLCSDASTCSDIRGMLLHGFVRFSTGLTQPTTVQAESPSSPPMSLAVSVDQTAPYNTAVNCFELFSSSAIEYFCLLKVNIVTAQWTGTTSFAGIDISSGINDDHDDRFKVCRYTKIRSNTAVVPADLANIDHPLHYVSVNESLTNQNYLVIRAGDDSNPFVCPNDNSATPNVNTATWYHQPDS